MWAGTFTLLAQIGMLFGIEINVEDLTTIALQSAGIASNILALYGRWVADRPIRW